MSFNKYFVKYKHAVVLKEIEFDEDCLAKWIWDEEPHLMIKGFKYIWTEGEIKSGEIKHWKAPFKSQVFEWFRVKHKLEGLILPQDKSAVIEGEPLYFIAIISYDNEEMKELFNSTAPGTLLHYNPYEEAEDACIDKLIELIKQKQNG